LTLEGGINLFSRNASN